MTANANHVARLPSVWEAQDTVTRPAGNTTQYTAGDAISDNATTATAAGYFALDFKTGQLGGSILLTDLTLHKSDHDVTTADIGVLLFTVVPAFAGWEDNAALAITDAEMQDCKGVVSFTAAGWVNVITGDIQTVAAASGAGIGIVFPAGSSTLYGIMVAIGAYTPADAEVFTLTAHAMRY